MRLLKHSKHPHGVEMYMFKCPGCGFSHSIKTKSDKDPVWEFNGDLENPTFKPSLLVRSYNADKKTRCHLFVTDGKIQFLNDCTHDFAGETIHMVGYEDGQ